MPSVYEGKFSGIPAAVADYLDANKAALGLKRVTLGSAAEGVNVPEAFVSIPDEEPIRFEKGEANRRPATIWLVPVHVAIEKEYPDLTPSAGAKPLTDAVLLAEKVADLLVAQNPLAGGARAIRLNSLNVIEGNATRTGSVYVVVTELALVYEVVVGAQ